MQVRVEERIGDGLRRLRIVYSGDPRGFRVVMAVVMVDLRLGAAGRQDHCGDADREKLPVHPVLPDSNRCHPAALGLERWVFADVALARRPDSLMPACAPVESVVNQLSVLERLRLLPPQRGRSPTAQPEGIGGSLS
jgi:hypothetical protein